MTVKRKEFSALQRRKLQQEAGNKCAWCGNSDAEDWEFHHINLDPSMTVLMNGIMLCRNCHGKANNGFSITIDQLYARKAELEKTLAEKPKRTRPHCDSVDNSINAGRDAVVSNSFNKTYIAKTVKPVMAPPKDSIGNDTWARKYVNHLVTLWVEFTQNSTYSSSVNMDCKKANSILNREFKGSYLHIPITMKEGVFSFIQKKIDITPLGASRKKAIPPRKNYSTYEEYVQGIIFKLGKE